VSLTFQLLHPSAFKGMRRFPAPVWTLEPKLPNLCRFTDRALCSVCHFSIILTPKTFMFMSVENFRHTIASLNQSVSYFSKKRFLSDRNVPTVRRDFIFLTNVRCLSYAYLLKF
jgi:hypothetical protein